MFRSKRILITPLNWGLGHATRCIPIIEDLLEQGAEVILGIDGVAGQLLRSRFPKLQTVAIPGLEVHYSKRNSQAWTLAKQYPAFTRSMKREHALTESIVADLKIDALISDNRFGCYSVLKPSVILTHQIFPKTPLAASTLTKLNHRWLQKFKEVWIVDHPEERLAGDLSEALANSRYIGTLSRFRKHTEKLDTRYRCVALVSGPSPHREMLLDKFVDQLKDIEGQHLVLSGIPQAEPISDGNVQVLGHLEDAQLTPFLLGCELIITRTGYTSLMDLCALGRSALLIPTPGQPEQEYLGCLHADGNFMIQSQNNLSIANGLETVSGVQPPRKINNRVLLAQALNELSQAIQG